jgi:Domain of unknown function (DUF1772)
MTCLRWVSLIFAIVAALPPLAHVLELPNKLALDGTIWLAVQQQLYRGWGPFLGGPAEIGALATSLVLLFARANAKIWRLTLIAAVAYAAMIATYFVFNAPVNAAVRGWTPASLHNVWPTSRLRWELGHAIAAVLSVTGLVALIRARILEGKRTG